jgi:hypothetical protein
VKDHQEEAAQPKPEPKKAKSAQPRAKGPAVDGGSRDARRLAAAILEVLGGARLPSDAAGALGISLPRYYLLETRALNGLIEACEPKPLGRVRSPEGELAIAQKDLARLRKENARLSALVRVAQRTIGLSAPPPPRPSADGKKRRKRKPSVRALRAVEHLKKDEVESGTTLPGEVSAPESPAVAVS